MSVVDCATACGLAIVQSNIQNLSAFKIKLCFNAKPFSKNANRF